MPIIDHLRDFVRVMKKYKAVQSFSCRKIEIRRTEFFTFIFVILFLELKILCMFEAKS